MSRRRKRNSQKWQDEKLYRWEMQLHQRATTNKMHICKYTKTEGKKGK